MILIYPTIYTDSFGTEKSAIISNGKSLQITLRGVTFEGHFWEWRVIDDPENNADQLFKLNEFNEILGGIDYTKGQHKPDYTIQVNVPLKAITKNGFEIDVLVEYRNHPFLMNFKIENTTSPSKCPNFESGLDKKHGKTLGIEYFKCCVNCKFSSYSPYGSMEYGGLMCFKKCKELWLKTGYNGLKGLQDYSIIEQSEKTQEAWWCNEFKLKED